MIRTIATLTVATLLAASDHSQGGTIFRFDTDPFAGSTALTTPRRQVVGGEQFIPGFSVAEDSFSFDPAVFAVGSAVSFFNGPAAGLPAGGVNVIVLQSTDNDNSTATPFGAGNAANLIAEMVTQKGAGFFIYHNSGLGVNRLVYSTDLSDNTADLKILARLTDPQGQAAIDALATFTAANFAIQAVPEPSTSTLLTIGSIGLLASVRSRVRRSS